MEREKRRLQAESAAVSDAQAEEDKKQEELPDSEMHSEHPAVDADEDGEGWGADEAGEDEGGWDDYGEEEEENEVVQQALEAMRKQK